MDKETIININKETYKNNYVVYHLHDEDSLLDSCTNYKLYIDKAKDLGQTAIAFTNHGNVYNWYKRKMYCDEKGIKFIYGIECYLTETLDENIRDNYHTILLAKNNDGFIELNNLVFKSTHKDHFYYKPRLSFEEFLSISDNVVKISACLASPLCQYKNKIQQLNKEGIDTKDKMDMYISIAKHYDYYEIQYHNVKEQIEYNQYLYKISKKYNKPLIMGTDTHSLDDYKAKCRIILKYGKTDGDWGDGENNFDLTYKSYDEVINMFNVQNSLPKDVYMQAIENTNVMANSIEPLKIDTSIKYPILYEGQDEEQIMWDRLRCKYKAKVDNGIIDGNNPKYAENIKEEMRVFKKINMVGFMLFMSEMMSWCREKGIFTSPCRGSVGGSTVAYISDIIDVDPIKWNTIFSRFANEYRTEVGDIDVDIYDTERQLVYDYIFNRFGKEKTAYILAMGTLADKSVIDTVGKAFRNIAKANDTTTQYTLENIKEIKKEYDKDAELTKSKYPDLFYYYDGLVGCVVSQSQHPAGVVAAPLNLIDNYSMFIGEDGQYILPIDMDEVHEIGLVKYDILGLKNIGIIEKTCKLANIPLPYAHTINWNDQEVFKDMIKSPVGIFQFEGDYAFKLLKEFEVKSIDDMSLVNASLRPSGASYRDKLLAHIPHKNPSKIIDKLLESNNGYLIYQEDTIKFLQQICGLSGSDADNVRRAIGRKQVDRLQAALPQILEGYCKMSDKPRDVSENEAKEFLQIISDSSSYQFGFNHSTGYSMVGYLCAYMRYYYPVEFCTSYLNCADGQSKDKDIYNGTMLAKQLGITIEMPTFRKSTSEFNCDAESKTIYKGIGSIKDIGSSCGDNLYTLKDKTYSSFIYLLNDIKNLKLANNKEILILIYIGFFSEFGNINLLVSQKAVFDKFINLKTLKKSVCDENGWDISKISQYCNKETDKQFSGIDMLSVIDLIARNKWLSYKDATQFNKIQYQLKYVGYTNLTDIHAPSDIYIIQSIETNKYGTPFISLYQPSTGITTPIYKVDKLWYNNNSVDVGDCIRPAFKPKPKKRLVESGKFEETGEVEDVMVNYYVVERIEK